MRFELSALPYDYNALEPYMSAETLRYHHEKHHGGYVDKLNAALDRAGFDDNTGPLEGVIDDALLRIIRDTSANETYEDLFNNAAQVWNHSFFWRCMSPNGGGQPGGDLASALVDEFGSVDAFKQEFTEKASGLFGSGYVWLIAKHSHLQVLTTMNAVPPLAIGTEALLGCDLWEHAYYLDHRNEREAFVESFINNLANWDFAQEQLARSSVSQ